MKKTDSELERTIFEAILLFYNALSVGMVLTGWIISSKTLVMAGVVCIITDLPAIIIDFSFIIQKLR